MNKGLKKHIMIKELSLILYHSLYLDQRKAAKSLFKVSTPFLFKFVNMYFSLLYLFYKVSSMSMCPAIPLPVPTYQILNWRRHFHKTRHEHHAIRGHPTFVPFNFLPSISPTWYPCKLV